MSTSSAHDGDQTLGRRLYSAREEKGWTQKKLAGASQLSVTFLSEVENDRRVPGTDSLARLAEALEVSLDYLVKGRNAVAAAAEPLVIPSELLEVAEQEHLTVKDAKRLLRYSEMATRSGKEVDSSIDSPALTKDQWRRLLEWVNRSPL